MATDQSEALKCAVCGESMTFVQSAECNWCDQRYHLNQRNDVEAKDCGEVWIDEQFLALQFACNNCLAAQGSNPSAAPVAKQVRVTGERRRYRKRE
jgi:hypothetical protein